MIDGSSKCKECLGEGGFRFRGGPGKCERCGREGITAPDGTVTLKIGITPEFRLRCTELERIAEVWGCKPDTPLDLDIIAYRIALNLPLDGEWRNDEVKE